MQGRDSRRYPRPCLLGLPATGLSVGAACHRPVCWGCLPQACLLGTNPLTPFFCTVPGTVCCTCYCTSHCAVTYTLYSIHACSTVWYIIGWAVRCTDGRVYACVYAGMYVRVPVHAYMCVCIHICACACIYVCMYWMFARREQDPYTCVHTYPCRCPYTCSHTFRNTWKCMSAHLFIHM